MKKIIAVLLLLALLPFTALADQDEELTAAKSATSWRNGNGWSFPIYGETKADLSPISDYLHLLEEHNIYISLPEMLITQREEYDWVSCEIGESIWLNYIYYHDGSRYVMRMQLPYTYRPIDEAFPILLASVLSVDLDDAKSMYERLKYNIIDENSEIRTDGYVITYNEPRLSNGSLGGFAFLSVEKILK